MIRFLLTLLFILYSHITVLAAPYLGDYVEDETVHFIWHTNDSNGASVTRSTNGTVSVYKDNGVTQSTAGITDTEDFDSLTGIHVCTIDLSADAFYATGANYTVVLSAATIDSQTVNAVLAHFSIENRFDEVDVTQWLGTAAATPTVAGVPEVDITHMAGGTQTVTDLKDFADAGYDPSTDKVQGVVLTDTCTTLTGHTAQTGDNYARLGAPAGASIAADIAAIEAQTDDIGVAGVGLTDLGGMSTTMKGQVNTEVSDVMKTDTISEMSQGAPPGSPTFEQAINYLYKAWRNKNMTDSSTIEIYDDAGTTVLFKSSISDDETDFTKGEYVSGP